MASANFMSNLYQHSITGKLQFVLFVIVLFLEHILFLQGFNHLHFLTLFCINILTTLLLWLEFHYRMLGFLEKVLTDFALHGLPW